MHEQTDTKSMFAAALAASAAALSLAASSASLSLDGEWRLDYFPQPASGAVRELPLCVPFETVRAEVPGNCELDLVRAGVLPPLEKGLNVLEARRFEGHQWLYSRTFRAAPPPEGGRAELVFGGIDTFADVFLNGARVGESDNMLVPRRFDVSSALRDGENTVQVLIRSALLEAREHDAGQYSFHMGFADGAHLRKAAFMGGWDIFPRLYASGLWRGVSLETSGPVRLENVFWTVDSMKPAPGGGKRCRLSVRFKVAGPAETYLGGASARLRLSRGGRTVVDETRTLRNVHSAVKASFDGAEEWWPRGSGSQPLYDAEVEIRGADGRVLASDRRRIGLRTVELVRDDVYGPERPGQFLFRINGEPIYVRGSNWVPVDALPGRSAEKIVPTLEMFEDLNCNMVRVWGGGVYEPEPFFDWCDEHGLMVWQDFMTGCAQFPQDDAYARATEDEAKSVVLALRNHPSLVLWSGNNENDESLRWWGADRVVDPNLDRNSRGTIPRVLREFDPVRPYLPSSPYVSPDVFAGLAKSSEMHLWGARGYYKTPFYTNSPCWFASEMGYHGMPCRSSIERMMTPECVFPWRNPDAKDALSLDWNDEWRLKSSCPSLDPKDPLYRRNDLMLKQAKIMFGDAARDLDSFVEQSQTVQAEAMKTFCELFRSRKFDRFNGLVWWNVRDGWPQLSDAVVDWYGEKKQAYYAIKAAQRDVLALMVDGGAAWVVNDMPRPVSGEAAYRDRATGRTLLEARFEVAANSKAKIGEVAVSGRGVVDIEYSVSGGRTERNHFLYGEPPFDWNAVREWTKGARIWESECGRGE